MLQLIESIRQYGILTPLIVRPVPAGHYEIISGHRRHYAAVKLQYRRVPVIIRVLDDDEAIVSLVDANMHREHLVPSEKAFACRMKYDAIKRKGGRRKRWPGLLPNFHPQDDRDHWERARGEPEAGAAVAEDHGAFAGSVEKAG